MLHGQNRLRNDFLRTGCQDMEYSFAEVYFYFYYFIFLSKKFWSKKYLITFSGSQLLF